MNLILNRDFKMPDDGWYQLAPLGEFPHTAAGVVQVVDGEACVAMVARFNADAAIPNFAGLLVDFDHFSLDVQARSEAAGWIIALEARCEGSGFGVLGSGKDGEFEQKAAKDTKNEGLWGQIRWSDLGEAAVKGGRYRFLSPVWARSDCVDLGPSTGSGQAMARVRPVRLLNAAVTNEPNLKGICPLSNASTGLSAGSGRDHGQQTADNRLNEVPVDRSASIERVEGRDLRPEFRNGEKSMKRVIEKLMNHLGLTGDASEDVILEKMQGLPGLSAVVDLQNSLKQAQDECDALRTELKGAEDEIVNRHLAEFEGVVTEKTKTFWTEQLMANRAGALAALQDLMSTRHVSDGKSSQRDESPTATRKPLHNRVTARPVIPGVGGSDGQTESQAVKIRNRAQEIVKSEKVPFSVAFRRAEKEVVGQ
jgi:phage I-like protein